MKRGSLQSKIPTEIREQLSEDPYMTFCFLTFLDDCNGKVEWNHAFTYAGKRINELWAILPMCKKHHREEARWRTLISGEIIRRILHFEAREEFEKKYPKSDLFLRGEE